MSRCELKAFLLGLMFISFIFSIQAQPRDKLSDSLSIQRSYVKFSVLPFLYQALRSYPTLQLIFHFESPLISKSKLTYNLVLDYHSWTYRQYQNGVLTYQSPNSTELYLRPQFRYYIGKQRFKGFYAGAFPTYLYRDIIASKGHYFGAGFTTGYQRLIRNKIPIEINIWISVQKSHYAKQIDTQGQPFTGRHTFASASLELNIGLPLKKFRR